MYTEIKRIHAREILDSRGNPTVEVEVILGGGAFGRTVVPLIAAKGVHEAHEISDGDKNAYHGKQVRMTVEHVNGEIADALHGMDALDQRAGPIWLDRILRILSGSLRYKGYPRCRSCSLSRARACGAVSNLIHRLRSQF
jgi:enolase